MNRNVLQRLTFFAVLLALIVWSGIQYRGQIDIEHLQSSIDGFGIWAPMVFICLYITATVLFLPGAVITISGGLIFGPVFGTLYNITGAVIGSTLGLNSFSP